MKKLLFLLTFFYTSLMLSQSNDNIMVVLDSKKLGLMKDVQKEILAVNPDDISTMTVFKDSLIARKYDSDYGVIIITRKNYILETFYNANILNSALNEKIKSPGDLAKIGVLTDKRESKNQPYDELLKYVYTNTANEIIKKVATIIFINPEDAVKINPKWTYGALEISAETE